jgi:hypothetical protein
VLLHLAREEKPVWVHAQALDVYSRKMAKRRKRYESKGNYIRINPDTWILLQVTEEVNDEPVRGKVIATARDPEEFQREWKRQRRKGVLTMLTYGPPLEPGPAVVVSAT